MHPRSRQAVIAISSLVTVSAGAAPAAPHSLYPTMGAHQDVRQDVRKDARQDAAVN